MEVGKTAIVKLNADVNSETQADIDYFRVSVVYGPRNLLLPSDWGSDRWIIHTTNVGNDDGSACNLPQSISFTASKEKYVTVFGKAFDVNGRGSTTDEVWTICFWGESGEPPDETIEDETGQDHYGGGHTENWLPNWIPSLGNWKILEDDGSMTMLFKIIISIVIIALFGIIAYFFPVPGGLYGKILVMILGVVLVILIWLFL